jgi:hypothetical protein
MSESEFWKTQGFETLGRYLRQDCAPDLRWVASNIHKYFERGYEPHENQIRMARGFMNLIELYDQVENRARSVNMKNADLQYRVNELELQLSKLIPPPEGSPTLGGKRTNA